MKEDKRIEWLDVIKCICMFFIMMGHFNFFPPKLKTLSSAFALTGFLFCSGYTFHLEKNIIKFIKKRSRQILIPMAWMGAIIILPRIFFSFNNHGPIWEEIFAFLIQIRGKGDELWFLALLFMSSILFYFLVLILKKPIKIFIVSFILCIIDYIYQIKFGIPLPWHIQMYGAACLFLSFGYLLKNNFDKIVKIFNKYILCIVTISYITLWYIYIIKLNNLPFTFYDFGNNIFFYLIFNFLGLFMLMEIAIVLKFPKIFSKIGENTLILYGLHGKFESIYEAIIKNIISNNTLIKVTHGIVGTIIITIIILIITDIINKYMPFLLGRKKVKE